MKILVADDDPVSRRMLEVTLGKWGFEVVVVGDGRSACELLREEGAPRVLILDWMMPEMDGIEVCRKLRQCEQMQTAYIILLTARGSSDDIVQGLEAGADDYVTKPFDRGELRARLHVAERVAGLQGKLADRVRELEDVLARLKQLQGLLPICSYCKKIRDDQNYWQQVEDYISEHSEAEFSHGICPDCYEKFVRPQLEKLNGTGGRP
jgi:sigma-B regulation protein RsbU (phosphoserine phosphatase)